jgi:hypothetical protein
MEKMSNDEIIQLLMNLSERFDCRNVRDLITELEVGEEFMKAQ